MIEVPENIDVNFLQCLFEGMKSDIDTSKNRLGFSSHQYCKRKVILGKIHNKKFEGNIKTLLGRLYEEGLYKLEVLQILKKQFSEKLQIQNNYALLPHSEDEWEVLPDRFIRIHPDLLSKYYIIEVKTTAIYKNKWKEGLASYQMSQLNGYLGYYRIQQGFLHVVNVRAFLSQSKKKEDYWEYLWNEFGHNISWIFNPTLYNESIKRIKNIFERIDIEDAEVQCPEMSFECKNCALIEECGKSEVKCRNRNKMGKLCQNKMYEWEECLSDKFIENPICKNCFSKSHPRFNEEILEKKYNEYKFIKKYLWS